MKSKSDLCLSCMRCCKKVAIMTNYRFIDAHAMDFYNARGLTCVNLVGMLAIVLEEACPYLGDSGCKIYNDRPKWCRTYDGRLDPLTDCAWEGE